MSEECGSHVSIETTLEILVGKWKPIIIYQIFQNEVLRFSELQRLIPGITKKMLTAQLRDLEQNDIIIRKVYPVVPPKVEYSISHYGSNIMPLIESMHEWAIKHLTRSEEQIEEQIDVPKSVVNNGHTDRSPANGKKISLNRWL